GGTTVTYGPENAVDGAADTAWRCDGTGAGERLEVSFPEQRTLTSVGLLPGYAKTDAYDGTDRYTQNRRISAVRYTFDDGSSVVQNFDTGTYRSLQTIALPNVSTSHLTITILDSVAGEATNGQPPFDKIAISEVAVSFR
ncbi:MAG TPA: discoidin domain-containing protein, partial [Pseudonocardiaceae bacterium]|nr:discoidin domain-containing protein [Pseudonocardiaceae bacterium]